MAATVRKNIWLYRTSDGVAPEIRSNQTLVATPGILIPNTPLFLGSTTGHWETADTCDGTGDIFHGLFVGLQDSTATWPLAADPAATQEIRVLIIDPDDTYAIFCENSGTDAAATQAIIGNDYGMTVSTTTGAVGYTTLDLNATTYTCARVVQVMGNIEPSKFDLTTTTNGVALVRFMAAHVNEEKANT